MKITWTIVGSSLLWLGLAAGMVPAQKLVANTSGKTSGKLRIYFVDVEGGQATLFVTPAGESLLIDTGWPSGAGSAAGAPEARDAMRIVDAAKLAGIDRIDYVLLTHYHVDHAGGVPALVARIPVGTFLDHGPNRETGDKGTSAAYAAYRQVLATGRSKHIVMHAGESLPIRGLEAKVISADGVVLDKPLPGAGQPNPFCKESEVRPLDQTENARSLGIEITFGKLKILDLGDLTWDKEMNLMCPDNRLGHVDILVVSHHGMFMSSSPALVDAVHARVAIMDNGANKGGTVAAMKTLIAAPGLETLWQLHYSNAATTLNQPEAQIANLQGADAGNHLVLTADLDGSFEVTNSRTGATRKYPAAR